MSLLLRFPKILFFIQEYKEARSGFFVISATLDLTLVIILAAIDIWNFYLAFSGNTAIEFWGAKLESQDPRV